MNESILSLKQELDALGPRGRGHRYPKSLREAVVSYVLTARRDGQTWQKLVNELGIGAITLQRWCEDPTSCSTITPLRVVTRDKPCSEAVTVVAPNGWRIEGLTFEMALRLMAAAP